MIDQNTTKTILIADDDHFVVTAFKSGLEHAGYDVTVATDGDETLGSIAASRPDLILLDLILPKQNGFEVLKTVKSDPKLSSIPVIVLTNLSQVADEEEARRYGAADFLVKANVSLNDILVRIDRLLSADPQPPIINTALPDTA
jgi:CheY-like chemotaxis protein